MEVKELFIYPVKGLRPFSLRRAAISPLGFQHDRTFCLQKVNRDPSNNAITKLEPLHIGYYLNLALFATHVELDDDPNFPGERCIVITYVNPETSPPTTFEWTASPDQILFPIQPDVSSFEMVEVSMHGSNTEAYNMGAAYSVWFSERLGFETMLVYIGDKSRAVLGSIAPSSKAARGPSSSVPQRLLSHIPFFSSQEEHIAFNDIGQYLVVTAESNADISSRLPPGMSMDVTKFRPNIVLDGAPEPFDEDFWGELRFGNGVVMALTANCYRCQSITVDYKTGKAAEDESGTVWKKLNRDRRVDKGAKWSPVFGRYGFCSLKDEAKYLRVGDSVEVTKRNAERTVFDWPGLTTYGTK